MDNIMNKIKQGNDGIYIPMVGENDLFVPWCVVERTERLMKEGRDKLPWGVRYLFKKAIKKTSRLSAINTITQLAGTVNGIGGRLIWREVEHETGSDI